MCGGGGGLGGTLGGIGGALLGTFLAPEIGIPAALGGGLGGFFGSEVGSTITGQNPLSESSLLTGLISGTGGAIGGNIDWGNVLGTGTDINANLASGTGTAIGDIASDVGGGAVAGASNLAPELGLGTFLGASATNPFAESVSAPAAWASALGESTTAPQMTLAPATSPDLSALTELATVAPTTTNTAASGTTTGTSSILSGLGGKALPALLGAGMLSNYMGQQQLAKQQQSNLSDYLANVTWTPTKTANYLNATNANTAGTVGTAGAKAKGTLAEQMASAGRGGGEYGAQSTKISEDVLNALASGRNTALTTVSTPPNLSAAPFMAQTNPEAETGIGLGGTLGNVATQATTLALLKQLGLFK